MEYLDETRPEPPLFPKNDPYKKALVGFFFIWALLLLITGS